jgi:hypothetical protein
VQLATSRFGRTLLQFKRRALWISGVAACLGMALAGVLNPNDTIAGALVLSVSASVLASLVVAAIALERSEFADYLLGLGIDQVFQDRLQDIPPKLWTDLLGGVHHQFSVLGMANHGYLNSAEAKSETTDALKKALERKNVRVEFLWIDPTSDLAKSRETEEGTRGLRRDACESILWFSELAATLPDEQRRRLSLRQYSALPTCGITWADNQLIVTHYLAGELNLRAPGIVLDAAQPLTHRVVAKVQQRTPAAPALARTYISNYQEVASDTWSKEITEQRLEAIRALHDELTATQQDKSSEADLRKTDASSGENGNGE